MTPMILLQNLSHRFMKMEFIALLIFDECHHAQMKSGHPYAEIMKVEIDRTLYITYHHSIFVWILKIDHSTMTGLLSS